MDTNWHNQLVSKRQHLIYLVIALTIPLIFLLLWHQSGTNYKIDDAFISYRYAHNLTKGGGLVWNLGEQPTQGYTNFLFVLLLSLGMFLKIEPLLLSNLLNAFGLTVISIVTYLCFAHVFHVKTGVHRIMAVWAVSLSTQSFSNALSGMETVFWTGLLFASLAFLYRYLVKHHIRDYLIFTVLLGFSVLTRPDSFLIVGICFVVLLISSLKHRPTSLIKTSTFIVTFAIFIVFYVFWLNFYFGYPLPNSFYLKVTKSSISSLSGLSYVLGFLISNIGILGIAGISLSLLLVNITRHRFPSNCVEHAVVEKQEYRQLLLVIALLSVPLIFLLFYAYTEPLMGMYYRFLFPSYISIRFLAVLPTIGLLHLFSQGNNDQESVLIKVNRMGNFIFLIGFSFLFFIPFLYSTVQQFQNPRVDILFETEMRIGKALNNIDDHEEILIAFGDAGVIPYLSQARVLDVIGLNNNEIARKSGELGSNWVIEFILNAQPDLIGFYSNPDGSIFNRGHGTIGNAYTKLYCHTVFQRDYQYLGGFDFGWAHLQWFARTESSFIDPLYGVFRDIVDFTQYDFLQSCNVLNNPTDYLMFA